MTLGLFVLGGLELLGCLEESVTEANRIAWIEWIYSQQRIPSADSPSGNYWLDREIHERKRQH
jgi:geranylgeranyl transferase type-1 subunit beta